MAHPLMQKHECTLGTGEAGEQRDGAGDAWLKVPARGQRFEDTL